MIGHGMAGGVRQARDAVAVRITLMGIQTSGKGTLGDRLAADLQVPHIAIGNLLRDRAQIGDELGHKIGEKLRVGGFADEAVVVQVLAERLADAPRGFVLDGFPRFGRQVQTLDAMLSRLGVSLDAAVHLELPEHVARERLANRLVCSSCGRSTSRLVSDEQGLCPAAGCAGHLGQRDDDRDSETVDRRLTEFRDFTMPVIAQYAAASRLIVIDVSSDPDAAYAALRVAITAAAGR